MIKNFINKNKKIIFWFLPIFSGLIFYFIINLINIFLFKINLLDSIKTIPDVLFSLFFGYLFFLFSKRISIFLIIQSILLSLVYISDSIKVAFFGAPIILEDLFSLKETLIAIWMINPLYVALISFIFLSLSFIFLFNIKLRKSGLILLSIFLVFIISLNIFPNQYNKIVLRIDSSYLFWNQQENYKHNGPFIYFLNQYIRSNNKNQVPTKNEVEEALKNLNKKKLITLNSQLSTINNTPLPNIHFILVESLWDPKLLNNTEFSEDPFYKNFRELRNEAPDNFLVSPTFEGKTADPEFELLCGMPVLKNNIVFQTDLKNNLDCLPKVLSKLGYTTNAFHPDYSNFYNRTNVYKKIGFTKYYSLNDFNRDDLNDGKLSDKSFLNQSYDATKKNKSPQFNYYLTLSTHIPYYTNSLRPNFISNNIKNDWITNYSNSVYYSTKEISEFINRIRKDDPNSIIIVTGDHLPFLGMNNEVYNITKTLDEKVLHSTPLIFINKNELEKTRSLNMFRFSDYLLNKIGIKTQDTLLNLFNTSELSSLRPLYVDKVSPEYINIENPTILNAQFSTLNYNLIYNDLLFGKQYSIDR